MVLLGNQSAVIFSGEPYFIWGLGLVMIFLASKSVFNSGCENCMILRDGLRNHSLNQFMNSVKCIFRRNELMSAPPPYEARILM